MIRDARPGDLEAIRAIAGDAYAPFVEIIGKPPAPMIADFAAQIARGAVRVAERDSIQGFAVAYPLDTVWHVENLAVAPETQSGGIGKALLADAEARAVAEGFAAIDLYTNMAMTGALAFYPRVGYTEIDRREEDGFHRVYFRKELR